ncbi:MAG: late competence development ComFB family protein [bacterium]
MEECSLESIKNRNERRVKELIPEVLQEFPGYDPEFLDLQDIYALTLNKLKPRYRQKVSLVLHEPITDEIIVQKIKQAIRRVKKYPNHN